jgi:rod shape-determining protein MreB
MLSAVLGLFSQDLAVDLGSSRTRVYLRGTGLLCDEPSVVAVQSHKDGRRRVVCVGAPAHPMLGRTPEDIEAIQPVRNGTIEDFEVAEALLLQLVRRSQGALAVPGLRKPRMAVALPPGANDMASRALRDSCIAAGAREVHLVPRAIAAALGADLPIHEPNGHLVVELGGSATEVSVLSLSDVVWRGTVPDGGEGLDQRIITWVRKHHALEIGRPTAERLKVELGSARLGGVTGSRVAKGRCLRQGIPRAVSIDAEAVQSAIAPGITAIAQTIERAVEAIPPELASDICGNGVILVGGGAQLDSLEAALRHLTGLPVMAADEPAEAVVRGAARVLGELELLKTVAA